MTFLTAKSKLSNCNIYTILTSIQLLAVAKTKDVRQFGVHVLLCDFVETLRKLGLGL